MSSEYLNFNYCNIIVASVMWNGEQKASLVKQTSDGNSGHGEAINRWGQSQSLSLLSAEHSAGWWVYTCIPQYTYRTPQMLFKKFLVFQFHIASFKLINMDLL